MLLLDEATRETLFQRLIQVLEEQAQQVARLPVAPALDPEGIRTSVVDGSHAAGREADWLDGVARHVVASGRCWISTARLSNGTTALRACITNFRTAETDLDDLIDALDQARTAQ